MKKLLCLLLSAMLSCALCACRESESVSENITSQISGESQEECDVLPHLPVINGTNISDYTIVYTETDESAKYYTAADALNEYFKTSFGFELKVVSENRSETENEIILGLSSKRDADDTYKNDFDYGEYAVEINGNKIVVAASYASGCYQGIEALIAKFDESEDGIFGDMTFEGSGEILKVACVGDSITEGINSTVPAKYTYPCYIQEMLGLDYYVLNAGLSGLSICKNDTLAYVKHPAYPKAIDLVPDIVIFLLGTNDANPKIEKYPFKNWEDPSHDRAAEFIESARELLDDFKEINSEVQIFMIYPPSLFVVGEDRWRAEPWTETLVTYVRPLLEQIAEEYNLPTVDLFDWSKENSDVFTDGLHPKDASYKTLAQYIYDNIKDTIKNPE